MTCHTFQCYKCNLPQSFLSFIFSVYLYIYLVITPLFKMYRKTIKFTLEQKIADCKPAASWKQKDLKHHYIPFLHLR